MNLHSSVKKGWRGRRSGVRWSHLWAKGPLWAGVRDSFLSQSHPGCEASAGKSGCQDLHRVIRGTRPARSSHTSRHLPGTWQPGNFITAVSTLKTAVLPTGTAPPPRGYSEGLPMTPFDRLASAHSRMAGTLSLSWGRASCLGWPGVSRTASGPRRGLLPIL